MNVFPIGLLIGATRFVDIYAMQSASRCLRDVFSEFV